jgi:hypothetical protein
MRGNPIKGEGKCPGDDIFFALRTHEVERTKDTHLERHNLHYVEQDEFCTQTESKSVGVCERKRTTA